MRLKKDIAVSILNVSEVDSFLEDLKEVKKKLDKIQNKEEQYELILHFDVMDGKFVDNLGVDMKWIQEAKKMGFVTDTHLMVKEPILDRYVETAIAYGTDRITVHYEIDNFEETLKYLNLRKEKIKKERNKELTIGVSIKPDTKVEVLIPYKNLFSKILIMTVEPGYGGQEYIQEMNEKIKRARVIFDQHRIQVDGGINQNTIIAPLRLGVDSFVIGTYLTKQKKEELYQTLIMLQAMKGLEELAKGNAMEFNKTILQITPEGYGKDDIFLGIRVPDIRKLSSHWYSYLTLESIRYYLTSNYHEYRRFAIACLVDMVKRARKNIEKGSFVTENKERIYRIAQLIDENIKYINNWDLTDEVAPNIIGKYLEILESDKQRKKELQKYLNSSQVFVKRIGIVAMLPFARAGKGALVLFGIDQVLYEKHHLWQKASGWVLRELYKKDGKYVLSYLKKNYQKKKLPTILLSYACEKMSLEEKQEIKKG